MTIKEKEVQLGYKPRSLIKKVERAIASGNLPPSPFGCNDPWTADMKIWMAQQSTPKESRPKNANNVRLISTPPPSRPKLQQSRKPVREAGKVQELTTGSAQHPLVSLQGYYWALGSMALVNTVSYAYSAFRLYGGESVRAGVAAAGLFALIGLGTALCMILNFLSLPAGVEATRWKFFAGGTIFLIDTAAMTGHTQLNAYLIPLAVAIAFTGGLAGAKKVATTVSLTPLSNVSPA